MAEAVVVLLLVAAVCPCVFGLDPSVDANQYAHKAWTVSDGFFKGSVYAIAQTSDGYLWIGTEFGLERFDGVRSVAWQPPKNERLPGGRVRSLVAARDGRLWVGTDQGLASWKDGKLTQYEELAGKFVLALLEDHEGNIWAAAFADGSNKGRLCTIRDRVVRCSEGEGTFNGFDGLYEDRNGKLWAGSVDGVWRWMPHPPKFFAMPIVTSSFAEGDRGELLVTTLDGIKTLVNEQPGPYLVRAAGRQSKFGKLLRDRDGGIWAGTYDGGLLHVHQGKIDRFTRADGLSSDNVLYLFEDREGSIWVGTRNGVDRFREYAVPALSDKQGLSNSFASSILQAHDGSIWLGTSDGLNRWDRGEISVYGKREGLPDPSVLALYEDRAGRIWVSTKRGVAYLDHGKFSPVPDIRSGSVVCMVGDAAGDIWISDQLSLYRVRGQRLIEEIPWIKLGHKDFAWTLLPDPARGGLWLGFREGGVGFFKDHMIRSRYGRQQGFGGGQVSGLKLDNDGTVWAATADGLNFVRGGQSSRLSTANGLPCDMVHWVVEDNDHFFWLYTACGVVRVARSELEKWAAGQEREVRVTTFDSAEGVQSSVSPTDSNPMVTKSRDGKIWFVTNEGVSVIDPHNLHENKLPPPVHVEHVTADDKSFNAQNGMRLPPRNRYLSIEYTALSMVAPERVRFRYKLDGVDPEWREVTNDREVQYSNIRPGTYRFHVKASNNSGVWNETGDTLEFVIPPMWYQTRWFYALCAASFMMLLWAAYLLRVRQLANQFNMRLEERVSERTRIARDLHDSLLQSFQGLLLRFQATINLLPGRPMEARELLEDAVEHASQAIIEGRDAISAIRMSTIEKNDLAVAIETIGQELAGTEGRRAIPFDVVVEGTPRDLHPIVRDEVYRLATEALRNAFRHAAAKNVEVELRYDVKHLRLRVRDDGKGIDPKFLREQGREGHYGLTGMRERAKVVGGELTIWTELDSGTEIELIIPSAKAYVKSARPFWQFGKGSTTETERKEPVERE